MVLFFAPNLVKVLITDVILYYSLSTTIGQSLQGRDLLEHDNLEDLIATYQHSTPEHGHILNTIGILLSEQKGDYQSAIHYHERALQIQENVSTFILGLYGSWKEGFFSIYRMMIIPVTV